MKKVEEIKGVYITDTAYVVKIRKQSKTGTISTSKSFRFYKSEQSKRDALREALAYQEVELESIQTHGIAAKQNINIITLSDVLDDYYSSPDCLGLKSRIQEQNKIKNLQLTKLANKPIAKLSQMDYDKLQTTMQEAGRQNSTIQRYQNTISVAIKLFNRKYGAGIPQPDFKPLKVANRRTETISKSEFETVLQHIKQEPTKTILECLFYSGARRSEITNLRIEYLKKDDKGLLSATLPTSKNDDPRHLFFNAYCSKKLEQQIGGRKTGFVFLWNGEHVNKDLATRAWVRARNIASKDNPDLAKYTVHTLRHSWITRLVNNTDLNILQIQALTAHKTTSMVKRYYQARHETMKENISDFLESDL